MNTLIVTDTYPPDVNGVARTLEKLAEGLTRRGHKVEVVTTRHPERSKRPGQRIAPREVSGVQIPGYRAVRVGFTTARRLRAIMEAMPADAVYVAVESVMGLKAVRAARSLGLPVLSGFHTNFHAYAEHYRLPFMKGVAARFLRWFHNRTARTLTPSQSTAARLRSLGVERVGVLGRGVDTELFQPAQRDAELRRQWQAADEAPVVAYVGRIAAEKNLPLVVKAMLRVTERFPGSRSVLVGDGPKADELREKHPQFIHAGQRTGLDLAQHYASADVFLFPSLTETYGNVLPEAMASGLVTVSYDDAAAHELVEHGSNGFKARAGDEGAFLAAADEAARSWNDFALRQRARATALTLSWEAIVEQFERELAGAVPASAASGALPVPRVMTSP